MELVVNDEAKDFLIEHGTDEKFGARPLRRAIEHHLEDALSEAMLRGDFEDKNKVEVSIREVEGEDTPTIMLTGTFEEPAEPEPVAAGQAEET
jgi:ATP-dependent Clp protease ATP-binding subunit ClpC